MRTLAIDCGGTGLKAIVLDAAAEPLCERIRVRTPYPCPPERFVDALTELAAATGTPYDRVSVGLPGAVRRGVVLVTPHYVTEAGPFTPARCDLVEAWTDFDVRAAVEDALQAPTRAVNDAELAGLAVVAGSGFEVVLTLGTGLGCALFDDGRLLPKVELSQARFRKGETYDEQLGHHVRKRIGDARWSRRVRRAVEGLRPVLLWDRCYLGGGDAKHLSVDLDEDVTLVPNEAGLRGGASLWERSGG